MSAAVALIEVGSEVARSVRYDVREVNALEQLIAAAETDADGMLWWQAERVVALLRGGMSQRALAGVWLNVRTGKPYSQMHVSFTARTFEKYTFQPRPRFRAAYNAVANAVRRDDDMKAQLHLAGVDPADADLRVSSCADLFATGIRPDAVITEPPRGAEHFSELARACVGVPHVAVRMDSSCLCLPEVLRQLCEHLTYRGAVTRDNRLILVFCPDDDAFARATGRARTVPGPTALRPYEGWAEYLVQRLAGPGDLVCDPFLRTETAVTAIAHGRRFVGCHVDPGVVADTRRQIGPAA
jgi:hypothetical protein